MTTDKKYEEAAKAAFLEHKDGNIHLWRVKEGDPDAIYWREIWTEGASFAEKEKEQTIEAFKTRADKAEAKFEKANKKNGSLYAEIEQLQEENQRLKEALRGLIETGDNVPAKIENARKLIEP